MEFTVFSDMGEDLADLPVRLPFFAPSAGILVPAKCPCDPWVARLRSRNVASARLDAATRLHAFLRPAIDARPRLRARSKR